MRAPDIARSFRPDLSGGYISNSQGGFVKCPPYIIAFAASERVAHERLDLPSGYTQESLERIRWMTGVVDQDVHISPRQAQELAAIGAQLLRLDLEPPLNAIERQSIEHLVMLAG